MSKDFLIKDSVQEVIASNGANLGIQDLVLDVIIKHNLFQSRAMNFADIEVSK